jgi:hypothetical protein
MRRKAYEIRGLPAPEISAPAPPRLLPIANAAAISWQGSVGATNYRVERASNARGPWTAVGDNIDETAVQYRPLFADANVSQGRWYYRVQARNHAGASKPSNVVGPVEVSHATLVDELADFALTASHQGPLEIKTRDTRKAKEDAHRLGGRAGDSVVYRLAGPISACKVYAFFPGDVTDLRFSVSADGEKYMSVPSGRKLFFQGTGDYGYWKPVTFECKSAAPDARYLRIEFGGEAQVGRVEVTYGLQP